MERHRKANAFPDLGTPGDPRLLAAIERRTPGIAGGGINHFFGGTVITPPRKAKRGGSSTYVPWRPSFFTEGTPEAPVYKCRFNLGTVNNVPAGNWNDKFTLPSDDSLKFVVITVTTESGKVTGVTISLDTAAPTEDSIAKDTPPVEFKIVLGAVGKQTGKMIVTVNLDMIAQEVFRETKTAPAVGGEPYSRWWRWVQYNG
jgi:hypothetical protein